MRTAFFGTPEIAGPALQALHETSEVVGVVCQPDRPRGRGMRTEPCAIKELALSLSLPVHQPLKVRTGTLDEWLGERAVECVLVMAYGRILPEAVLRVPRWGCLNLHASILPKYRGAAPIQWALFNGETETGISLMQMEAGLDTGPVYSHRTLGISPKTTAGELSLALADLAALVVREDLPAVFGGLAPTPQDEAEASWAPPIEPAHALIDWRRPARDIVNQVRALQPRPGAVTDLGEQRLKILEAHLHDADVGQAASESANGTPLPGTITVATGDRLLVQTGQGLLAIDRAQLPGKRPLESRDLINGRAVKEGVLLGRPE